MLSIGLSEILLIGVVVLLVVGPDRLPRLMRTAGRTYGQLRRAADDLRRAFVLEADRQDAEERMDALRERRRRATEARRRAQESADPAHPVSVPQAEPTLTEAEPILTEAEAEADVPSDTP